MLDNHLVDKINLISKDDVKKELLPVIKKGEHFDLILTKEIVLSFLKELYKLDLNESMFLKDFSLGNYNPKLLFDAQAADNAAVHPMAMWRLLNIKNK